MTRAVFRIAAAALLALPAAAAQAEGWTATTLATMNTEAECMAKADRVFQRYADTYAPGADVSGAGWTAAGYDQMGEDVDSLIICPMVDGLVEAFLVSHSSHDFPDERELVHDRLLSLWDKTN
ncbi:hypothetical protein [Pseudoroseicyclus sp. CXY001]|uniref:hypothetical protein n=1 Tax=Pseudoroseicyclus sp. CXY001 TaxID=3242492 RepID=UPI003570B8B5